MCFYRVRTIYVAFLLSNKLFPNSALPWGLHFGASSLPGGSPFTCGANPSRQLCEMAGNLKYKCGMVSRKVLFWG